MVGGLWGDAPLDAPQMLFTGLTARSAQAQIRQLSGIAD
jgi:hypothetical protein